MATLDAAPPAAAARAEGEVAAPAHEGSPDQILADSPCSSSFSRHGSTSSRASAGSERSAPQGAHAHGDDGDGGDGGLDRAVVALMDRLQQGQHGRDQADAIRCVMRQFAEETLSSHADRYAAAARRRSAKQAESIEFDHAPEGTGPLASPGAQGSEARASGQRRDRDRVAELEDQHALRLKQLADEFAEESALQRRAFEKQLAEANEALQLRQDALDIAHRLAAVGSDLEFPPGGCASRTGGSCDITGEERRELNEFEKLVMSSREKQKRLTDELSEMRVHMLGMDSWRRSQDAAQSPPDSAASSSAKDAIQAGAVASGRGASMVKIPPRLAGHKMDVLTSIVEEEDVADKDESWSEVAAEDVAAEEHQPTMQELRAAVKKLTAELVQCQRGKDELRENYAALEMELKSKVQRLTDELQAIRSGSLTLDAKALEVQTPEARAAALMSELRNEELRIERKNEDLRNELQLTKEARRIACNRLEDMRQELAATQRRCEQATREATIAPSVGSESSASNMDGADSVGGGGESPVSVVDLQQSLRKSEEERNLLKHTLEWKEVQWKSKMEHLELEHAELKRSLEAKAMKQMQQKMDNDRAEVEKLKQRLDGNASDFKARLDIAEQEKLAAIAQSRSAAAAAGSEVGASRISSLINLLRCPTRVTNSFNEPPLAVHCREIGWKLLGLAPGAIALLCDIPGLKVLDITESAKVLWDEKLIGNMVMTLLGSPTSAAWLRRAIVTHHNLASLETSPENPPGFAVHTLGQLEFRDGTGRPFESVVMAAHLPAEPKIGKPASVVVVVEPIQKVEQPRKMGLSRRSAMGAGGGSRAGSVVRSVAGGASVVSDDVMPCDSASNVATRH